MHFLIDVLPLVCFILLQLEIVCQQITDRDKVFYLLLTDLTVNLHAFITTVYHYKNLNLSLFYFICNIHCTSAFTSFILLKFVKNVCVALAFISLFVSLTHSLSIHIMYITFYIIRLITRCYKSIRPLHWSGCV